MAAVQISNHSWFFRTKLMYLHDIIHVEAEIREVCVAQYLFYFLILKYNII